MSKLVDKQEWLPTEGCSRLIAGAAVGMLGLGKLLAAAYSIPLSCRSFLGGGNTWSLPLSSRPSRKAQTSARLTSTELEAAAMLGSRLSPLSVENCMAHGLTDDTFRWPPKCVASDVPTVPGAMYDYDSQVHQLGK